MQKQSSAESTPTIPLVESTQSRTSREAVGRTQTSRRAILPALALLCLATLAQAARIPAQELRRRQLAQEPLTLIDVREPAQYHAAHIQGARSIPESQLATADLDQAKPIVVYCSELPCIPSERAAKLLNDRGYAQVSVLDGGFSAWTAAGYPVERGNTPAPRLTHMSAAQAAKTQALSILDVRPPLEFLAGRVPSASNIPLEDLASKVSTLDKNGRYLVYDRDPARSSKAARLLFDSGLDVSELAGGLAAWARKGRVLEVAP